MRTYVEHIEWPCQQVSTAAAIGRMPTRSTPGLHEAVRDDVVQDGPGKIIEYGTCRDRELRLSAPRPTVQPVRLIEDGKYAVFTELWIRRGRICG